MKNISSTMRLFIGLPLSPFAQRSLGEFCRKFRERAPDARWVSADLMHITLFFLGETDVERIPAITESLGQIQSQPLDLKIKSVGGFERIGIFFAAVQPAKALLNLAEDVRGRMIRLGFISKESEYRPHITLARAKRGLKPLLAAARTEDLPSIDFSADRFFLYRSHLTKEGSRYEVVKEFPL